VVSIALYYLLYHDLGLHTLSLFVFSHCLGPLGLKKLHYMLQYYKLTHCKPNFLLRLLLSLLFVVELMNSSVSVCVRIMANYKRFCVMKQESQSNGVGTMSKPASEKVGIHCPTMKIALWCICHETNH